MLGVFEIALDVFVDEKEAQKFRIAPRREHEPWRGDRRIDRDRAEPRHPENLSRAPLGQQPGEPDRARQHQRHRALGERARGGHRRRQQEPSAARRAVKARRARRGPERAERGGNEKRERRIERREAGEAENQRRERQDHRGGESHRRAEHRLAQRRGHGHLGHARERGRQTHGQLVGAEQLYRERLGPIDERRLFEIAHPVVVRGHVVVREHHLARDFRVASFVGLPQRGTAERGQIEDRREHRADQQAERAVALGQNCGNIAQIAGSRGRRRGRDRKSLRTAARAVNRPDFQRRGSSASFRRFSGAVSSLTSRGRL